MEADEIKKLETIKHLTDICFTALKPADDNSGVCTAKIRVYDYYELASVIRNLIKLCIVAIDQDAAEVPITVKNQHIDIGLILGIAIQLFPVDEFELINEISYLYSNNQQRNEEKQNENLTEETA